MRLYASAFREIAGEDSLSIVVAEDRAQKSFRLPVSFTLMNAIIGLTLLPIIFSSERSAEEEAYDLLHSKTFIYLQQYYGTT